MFSRTVGIFCSVNCGCGTCLLLVVFDVLISESVFLPVILTYFLRLISSVTAEVFGDCSVVTL